MENLFRLSVRKLHYKIVSRGVG